MKNKTNLSHSALPGNDLDSSLEQLFSEVLLGALQLSAEQVRAALDLLHVNSRISPGISIALLHTMGQKDTSNIFYAAQAEMLSHEIRLALVGQSQDSELSLLYGQLGLLHPEFFPVENS